MNVGTVEDRQPGMPIEARKLTVSASERRLIGVNLLPRSHPRHGCSWSGVAWRWGTSETHLVLLTNPYLARVGDRGWMSTLAAFLNFARQLQDELNTPQSCTLGVRDPKSETFHRTREIELGICNPATDAGIYISRMHRRAYTCHLVSQRLASAAKDLPKP